MIATTEIQQEEEIISRSVADSESFRPLYEKYFKRVFLFILRRVADQETSADLAQQVFLKALVGLGKFQHRGLPFSSWLYRIAINECNQHFRKSKQNRIVTLDDADVAHLFEDLTAEHSLESLHQKLPDILQQLNPEELYLIELRYFESRPFAEVGAILEITENHAKVKTYRVLDKMKKLFVR